ncbi:MAG: glycosyltransferase family 4 protein [Actinomycetota bacterium]|nr:glycosyltransferase family 4 protein [Actinomycetota bacterium]
MVAVVHPIHQHSYESVVAADAAGLLDRFYTGVYVRDGMLTSLVVAGRKIPGIGAFGELQDLLERRCHPELPSQRVCRYSGLHWLALASAQLRPPMLGRNHRLMTLAQRAFDLRVARSVVARRDKIGVLHAFDFMTPVTVERAHARGIATILDVTIAPRAAASWGPGAGQHPTRAVLDAERSATDWFLAGSAAVRDEVVSEGVDPRRVLLLPYGADPDMFQPSSAERARDVLFVGQLTRRKGLDVLLQAWRLLGPPAGRTLVLVGSPDVEGQHLLAGRHDVVVRSHISRRQVSECMRTAALFVLPTRAEGSALVIYEAMATGLPVVTTPAAGSVIRDGIDGCLVAPEPLALASAMDRILSDPKLGSRLGREAREAIVANYTWGHYRARLAAVYRAVLAGSTPRVELPAA